MYKKIAIIGTKDSILGFKAFGIDCYPVEEPKNALDIVKSEFHSGRGKYAVIYLTDDIASQIDSSELEKIKKGSDLFPILIIIPSHKGSLNLETAKVRRLVEKALGTDIFKEK